MEIIQGALPSFVDLLLDTVFLVDPTGRIVDVSAACEAIFGYTREEMTGRQLMDFIDPADRERTMAEAAKVMAGHERIGFENRYIRKDGSRVYLMWSARWSATDQLRVGVARDVSESRRAQERQAATYAISEAAHQAADLPSLCQAIHEVVTRLVPLSGFALATFDQMTRQLAFCYQVDAQGEATILHHDAARDGCAEVLRHASAPGPGAAPLAPQSKDDWLLLPLQAQDEALGLLALHGHAGAACSAHGQDMLHYIGAQVANAIQRRQMNADLLHSAQFDELTGLPNRRHFHERMKAALARCKRRGRRMAVLFVDIDGFKQVNDCHGHAIGDILLQQFAHRLKKNMRQDDSVARLGGDEFVILLEEIDQPADAMAVMHKIRHEMQHPFQAAGISLRTGASIGLALYPEHGDDSPPLLAHADRQMYLDKKTKSRLSGEADGAQPSS